MATQPKEESKTRKWLKLLLKIVVTVVCLWYVSGKIDFSKAGTALQQANWFYVFLALLAFAASKFLSALRLNMYFRNIGIQLPEWQNIKLYWLGMFYNIFLPGSIGGDAFKVILLTKKYSIPYKKTTAAVLLDRVSGLLGLGFILVIYGFLVLSTKFYIALMIAGGAFLAVIVLYLVIRYYLKDFIPSFFPTLFLGVAVQAMQVLCAYLIMAALGIPAHVTEYIFIFLVSSVVAVLPLTIGGLGARELVFLEGSKFFGLVQENSVIISILFYILTLITSLIGVWYVFREPLKKVKDSTLNP